MPYPVTLPRTADVRSTSPGCPDCGSQWGDGEHAHGVPAYEGDPGDRSLAGLLCVVSYAQRALLGDVEGATDCADPEWVADLLGQALARFTSTAP